MITHEYLHRAVNVKLCNFTIIDPFTKCSVYSRQWDGFPSILRKEGILYRQRLKEKKVSKFK